MRGNVTTNRHHRAAPVPSGNKPGLLHVLQCGPHRRPRGLKLTGDLPLHTEDEERDLRPALERRCEPEDNLDDVLKQLTKEHELNRDLVSFMVEDLEALADGRTLSNPVRLMMNVKEFSETQRQHVTWEERVLLPLARQRLTAEDLAAIGRNMAARRREDSGPE